MAKRRVPSSRNSQAALSHKVSIKRPKLSRSCLTCHIRKVKCDMQIPSCAACRRHARTLGNDPSCVNCKYSHLPHNNLSPSSTPLPCTQSNSAEAADLTRFHTMKVPIPMKMCPQSLASVSVLQQPTPPATSSSTSSTSSTSVKEGCQGLCLSGCAFANGMNPSISSGRMTGLSSGIVTNRKQEEQQQQQREPNPSFVSIPIARSQKPVTPPVIFVLPLPTSPSLKGSPDPAQSPGSLYSTPLSYTSSSSTTSLTDSAQWSPPLPVFTSLFATGPEPYSISSPPAQLTLSSSLPSGSKGCIMAGPDRVDSWLNSSYGSSREIGGELIEQIDNSYYYNYNYNMNTKNTNVNTNNTGSTSDNITGFPLCSYFTSSYISPYPSSSSSSRKIMIMPQNDGNSGNGVGGAGGGDFYYTVTGNEFGSNASTFNFNPVTVPTLPVCTTIGQLLDKIPTKSATV